MAANERDEETPRLGLSILNEREAAPQAASHVVYM